MSDFDYSKLAEELNASIEEKTYQSFSGAPVWRNFAVVVDETSLVLVGQGDDHLHVKKGMICFSIHSEMHDKHGRFRLLDNTPSINVSAKKTPVQVAADIRRRLLNPEAIKQVRKFYDSIRQIEEQTDAIIQKMQRAAQLIQSSESIGPDTGEIWTGSNFPVQFTVSNWPDNFVRVGDMTLTIEQLEKVCKALL